jgi:hypothetical protein
MKTRRLGVVALLVVTNCHRSPDPASALARADAAATRFVSDLRARLQSAMREGGPVGAVDVCAMEAPAIATRVSTETGVRVGRASLRTRNPANVAPPWVATWLQQQGERSAEGVVGFRTVEGGVARVLRPIAVEGVCVVCHGDPESIAPVLREALRARYPTDRATGYRVGDLRGALWAEASLGR